MALFLKKTFHTGDLSSERKILIKSPAWRGNFVEKHSLVLGNSPKIMWNCAFPQNFHTEKLVEITVFLAVNKRKLWLRQGLAMVSIWDDHKTQTKFLGNLVTKFCRENFSNILKMQNFMSHLFYSKICCCLKQNKSYFARCTF